MKNEYMLTPCFGDKAEWELKLDNSNYLVYMKPMEVGNMTNFHVNDNKEIFKYGHKKGRLKPVNNINIGESYRKGNFLRHLKTNQIWLIV